MSFKRSCDKRGHLCAKMVAVDRGQSVVTSEAIGLKLVCRRKINILKTECDANRDANVTDLDCLKVFVKFRCFVQRNDTTIFSDLVLVF